MSPLIFTFTNRVIVASPSTLYIIIIIMSFKVCNPPFPLHSLSLSDRCSNPVRPSTRVTAHSPLLISAPAALASTVSYLPVSTESRACLAQVRQGRRSGGLVSESKTLMNTDSPC